MGGLPLYLRSIFANAEHFARALAVVDQSQNPVEWFLLNAEANIDVDLTAVDALDELRRILAERGIVFAVARVKKEVSDLLISVGFVEKLGSQRTSMTCLPSSMPTCAGTPTASGRRHRTDLSAAARSGHC